MEELLSVCPSVKIEITDDEAGQRRCGSARSSPDCQTRSQKAEPSDERAGQQSVTTQGIERQSSAYEGYSVID